MTNDDYQGVKRTITYESNFSSDFYNLRTRIAGGDPAEICQLWAYIIGDFGKYDSDSVNAFILEYNRGNLIFFCPDLDMALEKLTEFWRVAIVLK